MYNLIILFHLYIKTDLQGYSYVVKNKTKQTKKSGHYQSLENRLLKGFCNDKYELEGILSMFTVNDHPISLNIF